jgi:hypothetical protein
MRVDFGNPMELGFGLLRTQSVVRTPLEKDVGEVYVFIDARCDGSITRGTPLLYSGRSKC